MEADGTITREGGPAGGRYVLRSGALEAELVFSPGGTGRVVATHTGVPAALRGAGAGRRLVERLVADARAEGFRIVALCPFVKAQALRHPEWADAFA
ncbi:MAG: N-acetyltransferase [Rhodobacteraceae bacterium]|nr:N-acetyltransferase [Paracoccaceae bacterium]